MEIVEATIKVIEDAGLAAATVRNVAKSIGVSPGQIHHHFSSIDDLRSEAFLCIWKRLRTDFDCEIDGKSAIDRILVMTTGCEDFNKKSSFEKIYRELLEVSHLDTAMQKVLQNITTSFRSDLRAVLKDAQNSGELSRKANIDQLAHMLLGLSYGIGFLSKIGLDDFDRRDLVQRLIDNENRILRCDLSAGARSV